MEEKRKAERVKDFNEVSIKIISDISNFSKEKNMHNYSEDISTTGVKIRGNIVIPVDMLLKIDFKLKNLQNTLTAVGKVKWIKIIIEDKYYEAGVEFVDTPDEAIQKISDYISWKKKNISLKIFHI
jgi:c-di-GMP-binding flagellar brake protein YcgR